MELVEMGHTGWTDNNRSVHLLCLYLFEYQDAFQMNTNIWIIRTNRIVDIQMRTLTSTHKYIPSLQVVYSSTVYLYLNKYKVHCLCVCPVYMSWIDRRTVNLYKLCIVVQYICTWIYIYKAICLWVCPVYMSCLFLLDVVFFEQFNETEKWLVIKKYSFEL